MFSGLRQPFLSVVVCDLELLELYSCSKIEFKQVCLSDVGFFCLCQASGLNCLYQLSARRDSKRTLSLGKHLPHDLTVILYLAAGV